MGAYESGNTFLAGVLAKLSPEQQAQAKAIFESAEAKDAVSLIGDATLARSDYSRSMDQLRQKEQALSEYYTSLDGWYTENKTVLDAARAGGSGDPAPTPAPAGGTGGTGGGGMISAADARRIADEAVNEAGRDYIAVTAFLTTQGGRHAHMFNEPLDMNELVANPKLGKPILGQPGRVYSLADAYNEKYGERLAAKQKETEDKRINDLVEARYSERLKQTTSTHPFPLRAESSPLDALSTKDGTAVHTLDSAVAEYERLVAAKQG